MGGTHFESMQYATHLQYITAYPGAYGAGATAHGAETAWQGRMRPCEERMLGLSARGLPGGRGRSHAPHTVSARRVAGPQAGGNGALAAHVDQARQAGHAPRVGILPGPAGVPPGGLACPGPGAWLPALYVWLRAPLDG